MEGVFTLREQDISRLKALAAEAKPGDTLQIIVEGGAFAILLNPNREKKT